MKLFRILALSLTALLPGCALSSVRPVDPKCECNWTCGHRLTMELEENATTGYGWSKPSFDPAVVVLEKNQFIAPVHGLCGAPGKRVFVFRGIGKGMANIRTEYRRPWEKDVKPIFVVEPKIQVIGPRSDGEGGLVRIDEDMLCEFRFPKADVNRD